MKHFLIATNFIKDENLQLTSKVERYIAEHGGSTTKITGQEGNYAEHISDVLENDRRFDCVMR